jgi:hypothetical protein
MSYCWACDAHHKDAAEHAACAFERGKKMNARRREGSETREEAE